MKTHILSSLKILILLSLICGILYPFFMTGVANALFSFEAQGSLVRNGDGRVIGSALIGQKFTGERYFHGRPSAVDFATVPSGASNLSPTSAAFKDAVKGRAEAFGKSMPVPSELLMASGSGLDPHLTVEGAEFQAKRIALARGIPEQRVQRLIEHHAFPQSPFDNSLRLVNVLELNLALEGGTAP